MIISQGYIYWGDGILPESRHQCVTHQVESGFRGIGYKQRELLRHPRIHNLCEVESQSQQLDEHRDHKWSRQARGGGAYRLGGVPKYIWASTLGVRSNRHRVWIEIYEFSKSVSFHRLAMGAYLTTSGTLFELSM